MIKTILLDTSFVIACAQFRIDYFSEIERLASFGYKIKTLDKVIAELNNIIETGGLQKKRNARLAKTILERKNVEIILTEKKVNTDDSIVLIADKDTFVATIDAGLKKRLKNKSYSVIFVRQKKYLQMLQS